MEVVIQPNAEKAALLAAKLVAREVFSNPSCVLGLATGRTMERVYEYLVGMYQKDNLDFSLCRTYNLDEYIGLHPSDPSSYRHYMNQHLFHKVNIDLRNTRLPDGMADDIVAECARYEDALRKVGGIDLQLLGIGPVGHIGFNEPLSALRSRTRVKTLTPATVAANAPFFGGDPDKVPRRVITMGVGTILDSKRCVLLACGANKAGVIAKAVEGPITSMISASALQLHARCTVIVDEAAAEELAEKDYYRWIFEHEPEWKQFRE